MQENHGKNPDFVAFQIAEQDNVATCLQDTPEGALVVVRGAVGRELLARERIPRDHKVASGRIARGADVIKFNTPIGKATQEIQEGAWVHLHNLSSSYDERSGSFDTQTGATSDTVYE